MSVYKKVLKVDRGLALRKFGVAVQNARKAKGLTQQECADLVDATRTNLAQIEVGRSWPGIELMVALTEKLGVSVSKDTWK